MERLKFWERGDFTRFKEPREQDTVDSIINHISFLLNTKQGNMVLHDDYGIPEFHNLPVHLIESSISDVISKYEPRFIVDEVFRDNCKSLNPSKIMISIVGKIRDSKQSIVLSTVLTSSGRVFIKL